MSSTFASEPKHKIIHPKVVWHDPNINSVLNKKYVQDLKQKSFNVIPYSKYQEAINYFTTHPQETFIAMTSANTGQEFLDGIAPLKNISGVIVYCLNRERGLALAQNCFKPINVCTAKSELLKTLEDFAGRDFLQSLAAGNSIEPIVPMEPITREIPEYYCYKPERVMDFLLIRMLFNERADAQGVREELCALSGKNTATVKKYFKGELKQSFDFIRAFCMAYSSCSFYEKFNNCFATRNYKKVIKTLTVVLRELKKESNRERIFCPRYPRNLLYRGIPRDRIDLDQYKENSEGFWPSFTSTSFREDCAKRFARDGGVIFVISLSAHKTHPNIIMRDMTIMPWEKEVLLIPFFAFRVTRTEEVVITSKTYTKIHIEQREEDSVLSLSMEDTSAWVERIRNHLWISIEDELDEMCESFCDSLKSDQVKNQLRSEEFKDALCQDVKTLCSEAAPSLSTWNTILSEAAINRQVQDAISQAFSRRRSQLISSVLQKNIQNLKNQNQQRISKSINMNIIWEPKDSIDVINGLSDQMNYVFSMWDDMTDQNNDPKANIKRLAALLETIAGLAPTAQLSGLYDQPEVTPNLRAAYLFYEYLRTPEEKIEEALKKRIWEDWNQSIEQACYAIERWSTSMIMECKESFEQLKDRLRETLTGILSRRSMIC